MINQVAIAASSGADLSQICRRGKIAPHIFDDAKQIRVTRSRPRAANSVATGVGRPNLLTPGRSRQQNVARSSECRVVQFRDLALFVGNGEPCPIRLGLSVTAWRERNHCA